MFSLSPYVTHINQLIYSLSHQPIKPLRHINAYIPMLQDNNSKVKVYKTDTNIEAVETSFQYWIL